MTINLDSWAAAEYPDLPHIAYGRSGATLLLDALQQEGRRTIILPAFTCPELPAMAMRAGLRLLHVDVDRHTLHCNADQLTDCLAGEDHRKTVLLVDHTFGYPMTGLIKLRQAYPELLIIEDCVRALGSEIGGRPVGHHGDWVLFSMYKTTVGNDHGALLLTRTPYAIRSGPAPSLTIQQWAAGIGVLRLAHGAVKRFRPDFSPARQDEEGPFWAAMPGVPNRLSRRRFERQLTHLATDRARRSTAADEIQDGLRSIDAVQFIRQAPGSRHSSFYLSFIVGGEGRRDALVTTLHRKGLFLAWAWNAVPALYRSFANTFPYGASESLFLADHICHVPLEKYVSLNRRRALIDALRDALGNT